MKKQQKTPETQQETLKLPTPRTTCGSGKLPFSPALFRLRMKRSREERNENTDETETECG